MTQVAKVLGSGGTGFALSYAVEQLLGAVDWVLDPANNRIIYFHPDISNPSQIPYLFQCNYTHCSFIYNSATEAQNDFFKRTGYQDCKFKQQGMHLQGVSSISIWCVINDAYYNVASSIPNPAYDPTAETRAIPLETVAQQVIENAESDNLDAQFAILVAVQDILVEAEQDDVKAQPIVNDLENNANNDKCPSGIKSEKGQCWVCAKEDYSTVTQRTKLAKAETSRLGKCLPEMENTELFTRINAFNEFVQARVNENSCWAPLDPGHIQQEQDGRNGAAKCTKYIK